MINTIDVSSGMNNVFSTPIFISQEEYVLSDKQKEIILNKEKQLNAYNTSSVDSNILDYPEFKRLKEFCKDQIDYYAHVLLKIRDCDFYITQSWLNYAETNESHHEHSHHNSIMSGVYYISPNVSTIIFHRKEEVFPSFSFNYEYYDITTALNIEIKVPKNRMIIFPSSIYHSVDSNKDKETRISLAFNTFVKGSMGDYDGKTLLKL